MPVDTHCIAAGDKVAALEGHGNAARTGHRPPASAGSKRTLRPINLVSNTAARPATSAATQKRQTTLRFADGINQQAQVHCCNTL